MHIICYTMFYKILCLFRPLSGAFALLWPYSRAEIECDLLANCPRRSWSSSIAFAPAPRSPRRRRPQVARARNPCLEADSAPERPRNSWKINDFEPDSRVLRPSRMVFPIISVPLSLELAMGEVARPLPRCPSKWSACAAPSRAPSWAPRACAASRGALKASRSPLSHGAK